MEAKYLECKDFVAGEHYLFYDPLLKTLFFAAVIADQGSCWAARYPEEKMMYKATSIPCLGKVIKKP